MKPDQIREEPQLISPDLSNSNMNVSMDVQPGDDPLSQLAAKSGVPKDENSNDRIQKSMANHNLVNHDDLLNVGRTGVVQYGQCLNEEDHHRLRNFVMELVTRKLLPHLNEVLKNLNEWVNEVLHTGVCGVQILGTLT